MDVSDVGALVEEANVKRLALNHLAPKPQSDRQADMFYGEPISELYTSELFVGEDGKQIVIPVE
jgi:ribonuclease BN (tRNA processing enzyme)